MNINSDLVLRCEEIVRDYVAAKISELSTRLHVLGPLFLSGIADGDFNKRLEAEKFFDTHIRPIMEERSSWMEW